MVLLTERVCSLFNTDGVSQYPKYADQPRIYMESSFMIVLIFFPRFRLVISRLFDLNRWIDPDDMRILDSFPDVKLKPKNFRLWNLSTAVFF